MNAILIMIVFMGSQSLNQVIIIPVSNIDFCQKNKQQFIDSAEYAGDTRVKKATCLVVK